MYYLSRVSQLSGPHPSEFGFVWLTPKGMEIAIQELGPEREEMAASDQLAGFAGLVI
jgi:hypothetical protein